MDYIKVKAVSKFGFLIDGRDDWFKCDKSLLSKDVFKNLRKGDELSRLEFNGNGFVKALTVLNHKDQVIGGDVSNHLSSSVCASPSPVSNVGCVSNPGLSSSGSSSLGYSVSIQDSIRYAQCVNIAFENFNLKHTDLMFQPDGKSSMILEVFDLADKIYLEFNKRLGGN